MTIDKRTGQSTDNSVTCPQCEHRIYDGEVVRSRCVRLHEGRALCRCKAWLVVPIRHSDGASVGVAS